MIDTPASTATTLHMATIMAYVFSNPTVGGTILSLESSCEMCAESGAPQLI